MLQAEARTLCLPAFCSFWPTRLGWAFQAGKGLGVLGGAPGSGPPALALSALCYFCPLNCVWLVLWLASQAARIMEASSAGCCQLPGRHPESAGQTASSLPLQESPVAADKWPMSFSASFSLLVHGLSCPDNPFHLVLSLWLPRRSPGSDSPAFAPTKRRRRQAAS